MSLNFNPLETNLVNLVIVISLLVGSCAVSWEESWNAAAPPSFRNCRTQSPA